MKTQPLTPHTLPSAPRRLPVTFHVSRFTFPVSPITPRGSRLTPPRSRSRACPSFRTSGFGLRISRRAAFTLIELIAVISVMALLAAMVIPITGAMNKQRTLKRAYAELKTVEAAIGWYKDKLGHYPPDNPQPAGNPYYSTNQLYYELLGTKLINNGNAFSTLDGSSQIPLGSVGAVFVTVSGFVNCTQGGGGDEGRSAQNFYRGLRPGQFLSFNTFSTPWSALGSTAFDGPLVIFDGAANRKLNPWSYNSSRPFKNPNSYDLWMDIRVGSTIYRVCNWSSTPLNNVTAYP